jgi:beta-glucanase (GH16 family)
VLTSRRGLPRPAATIAAAATLAVALSAIGASAASAAPRSITVAAAADTTYTQVAQDGDNGVKSTLASCPATCEGNGAGLRQPTVGFTIAGLPVAAARLELSSWRAFTAQTTVFSASGSASGTGSWANRPTLGAALASRSTVTAGTNAWDVTSAVRGNGNVTLALRQGSLASRVYWASKENATTTMRPRLVISYDVPVDDGWNLVWRDEFDGSTLDKTKWTARDTLVDYDRACITSRPQNVLVGQGTVTLRARHERYSCGGQTRDYTTSYLDTRGLASFAYGRFETRAKSPNGPTNSTELWPAAWMRPDDGGAGEIDVVELPGGPNHYRAATAAIFQSYTPLIKQDLRWTFPTGHPGDGFHTYATEWKPGSIRWLIDGREIWRRDGSTTSWLEATFGRDASSTRKFHLRLNFQVGGWLGDPDAATAFPADFVVDYVRVWQQR